MEPSQHQWLLGTKLPSGELENGPTTDIGKLSSKRHIVVDARGIPMVILVSSANRHDSWVVERTHGWFAGFDKLRIRFERRLDIHEALAKLAAAIICARFVDRWF